MRGSAGSVSMVEVVISQDAQRRDTYRHYVLPEVDVLLRVALSMTRSASRPDVSTDI